MVLHCGVSRQVLGSESRAFSIILVNEYFSKLPTYLIPRDTIIN